MWDLKGRFSQFSATGNSDLLVKCLMQLGSSAEVLNLCEYFPHEKSPDGK